MDRYAASLKTGYPEWPCPECGHDGYRVYSTRNRSKFNNPRRWAVTCSHCSLLMDAHWIDGAWMGRYWQAKHPGSLTEFVAQQAALLRVEERIEGNQPTGA